MRYTNRRILYFTLLSTAVVTNTIVIVALFRPVTYLPNDSLGRKVTGRNKAKMTMMLRKYRRRPTCTCTCRLTDSEAVALNARICVGNSWLSTTEPQPIKIVSHAVRETVDIDGWHDRLDDLFDLPLMTVVDLWPSRTTLLLDCISTLTTQPSATRRAIFIGTLSHDVPSRVIAAFLRTLK